jgi:preprotein translocase subunit YajC
VSGQLVFLIAIGALFYFMLVLPQRRKARQQQALTASLKPGAEVMTTAGLFATVHDLTDDEVYLEVAPGVVQRYAKGAIMRVIPADEPQIEAGTEPDDEPRELGSGGPGTGTTGGASSDDGSSDPPAAPRES